MGPDPGGPLRVALACEDQAQRALLMHLSRNVVLKEAHRRQADWLADTLDQQMAFCGLKDHAETPEHLRFYHHDHIAKDFGELRIGGRPVRLNALREGRPAGPEAQRWRRLTILFGAQPSPPDVLMIALDTDGHPERREALQAARSEASTAPIAVILATPHPEAEAWFVAGFEPLDGEEAARLDALRKDRDKKLNFIPTEEPHRLTAHPNDAPTDAKRVLRFLMFGDYTSRAPELSELPDLCERLLGDLDRLTRRSAATYLGEFLRELREILVPLLLPGPPPSSS
ncbi:hypothetical protein [Chondromyces apiculatus]|uniref:hypothetical protein n=1 Tax=Chondromyces apiculatus TaxID=51 RepID=UPI0012DDB489|nr:hypothetical protein [Chondromyces apiculatus]